MDAPYARDGFRPGDGPTMSAAGAIALALAVLIGAGAALSVQGAINAALARYSGDAVLAACISFLVGFLVLAAASLMRGTRFGSGIFTEAPWWVWTGGVLGGF